jgi:ABC-type transport system involved in multi-copper enzyme maturation permease subunit
VKQVLRRLSDRLRLIRASLRLIAGRRYWISILIPLVWIGFQVFRVVVNWRPEGYNPGDAQTILIGFPLTVLGIAFGLRIIAGEIDHRTLEIAYTVPGGTHRVWIAKLGAALVLLIVAEALLALATWAFCTGFPPSALYGALQAAVFYMVLSMALAALLRSEAGGALLVLIPLGLNFFLQAGNVRISPFWNPERISDPDPAELFGWAVQNRVGFLLAIAAITAMAFARAERREKLLGG